MTREQLRAEKAISAHNQRRTGTITVVVPARGFAFAQLADGREVFIHRTACMPAEMFDTLERDHVVTFMLKDTAKGLRAYDVYRPKEVRHGNR